MKNTLIDLIQQALQQLKKEHTLPEDLTYNITIESTKDKSHGDYACNIAMVLAKRVQMNPRELAEKIKSHIPSASIIKNIEIAGPGFINFTLNESAYQDIVQTVLKSREQFGRSQIGAGQKIHLEWVSSNPTGPLHVGHGRSAAYGSCLANVLQFCGYNVHREYYVNDVGRQMRILGVSVWLRYLEAHGVQVAFPENGYQGDYVIDIAKDLKEQFGNQWVCPAEKLLALLPKESEKPEDKEFIEFFMDELINAAVILLDATNFEKIRAYALKKILADIKEDLSEFGVTYDEWFHESQLFQLDYVNEVIETLKKSGHTYERDGALWLNAIALGDEKDRVLIRKDGHPTYFAPDIAYHWYKYARGFDTIVDVFGSDHHGYVPRIRASMKGLGKDPDQIKIILVQFAILYRGKERVSMSTRSGTFVTLRELRQEVGNDAARYFYIMRKPDQHLDFDLELAKSKSNENPVYYVQYAHARICSVWRQLKSAQKEFNLEQGLKQLPLLVKPHEKDLMNHLGRFPEIVQNAARFYEPHVLANYLQELAHYFHTYYNAEKFIVEDPSLRNARLCLVTATQQVLINGLNLMGLSAPEAM